jgi:hypothetical protein
VAAPRQMTPTETVEAVRRYIWFRAHETPGTMVDLHDILGQLLKILDGGSVLIRIGDQTIAVDASVLKDFK